MVRKKPIKRLRQNLGEQRAILSRSAPRRITNDLRLISMGEKSRTFRRMVRRHTRKKLKRIRRRELRE